MTHDEIASRNVVELYATGRLSPEESARFEAHFVDCAQCMDQLDTVERLRTAMRPWAAAYAISGWGVGWLAAAAILLAAAASLFFAVRDASMRKELERARATSLEWQHRFETKQQMPLVASTFYLSITRGADSDTSEPVNRVTISPDTQWIALSPEGEMERATLVAKVTDATGAVVWEQSGIQAAPHQALSLILPARVLHTGDYVLTLSSFGRYRFRVSVK